MSQNKRLSSRRSFLKQSVASAGAAATGGGLVPYIFTSQAAAATASGDRPLIGCIGLGGQGSWNMELAMKHADVAAVCDVDSNRLAEARKNAQAIAEETRASIKADIDNRRADVEAGLNKRISEAETRIAATKSSALANVDEIAADTAQALVAKIAGGATVEEARDAVAAVQRG